MSEQLQSSQQVVKNGALLFMNGDVLMLLQHPLVAQQTTTGTEVLLLTPTFTHVCFRTAPHFVDSL